VNPEIGDLHSVITQLLLNLKEKAPDVDSEMTVPLDLFLSSVIADQPIFEYYFASHTHKRVFWLEDFSLACLSEECDGSMESSFRCKLKFMLKHACELPYLLGAEAQYWWVIHSSSSD